MQGQGNVRLVVPTHVETENVSDEESSLETSTLGSITTSSYDILNKLCIIFDKYFAFNEHIACRNSPVSLNIMSAGNVAKLQLDPKACCKRP